MLYLRVRARLPEPVRQEGEVRPDQRGEEVEHHDAAEGGRAAGAAAKLRRALAAAADHTVGVRAHGDEEEHAEADSSQSDEEEPLQEEQLHQDID